MQCGELEDPIERECMWQECNPGGSCGQGDTPLEVLSVWRRRKNCLKIMWKTLHYVYTSWAFFNMDAFLQDTWILLKSFLKVHVIINTKNLTRVINGIHKLINSFVRNSMKYKPSSYWITNMTIEQNEIKLLQ